MKRTLETCDAPVASADIKQRKVSTERILFATERSCLKIYHDDNIASLLKDCVKETEKLLIVNPPVTVYGKPGIQHRSIGFFSDSSIGYQYSGQLMASQKLGLQLTVLLEKVNALLEGANFNGILVNRYANGKDFIGQHVDDEKDLASVGVVTISFGAERTFRITDRATGKLVKEFPLAHGTIYHMAGAFQREFKHGIPKQSKVVHPRISFTFRKHLK